MGFFDFNIPYLESSKPAKPNTRLKETRIKLTGKSMELGYTGIAYSRTITGVMSDNDFCTISLLPLSSLLKLSPSFPSSVKLHREALGVPLSSPFRQYTRLTVVVDNAAQATSLNSGNPILRTYDLVALRPTNQTAFEQACLVSEVDIISIDFSENKPFRLRQATVKAAIQRGLYFEIAYSDLLADARTRRRVIDNAKLLVNWTRGKNLIFSSAALSVNELRGPYDVTNLMSLLGVSMERAKAAISKNCRTLIANALRKKQCYKEAIRVEVITPDEQVDSKEPWFGDWLNYDPISSGEGDLLLEDMAKSFSASNKVIKTVKAIDFASIMDSIPSHGLQLKDLISGTKALQPLDDSRNFVSAAEVVEVSVATKGASEETRTDQILLTNPPLNPIAEHTIKSFSPKNIPEDFRNAKEIGTHTTIMEDEPKISNGLDLCFVPIGKDVNYFQPQDHGPTSKLNDIMQEPSETHLRMAMDVEFDTSCTRDASAPFMNHSSLQDEEHEMSINSDVLGAENVAMDGVLSEIESNDQAKFPLASSSNMSLNNYISEGEHAKDMSDEVLLADERLNVDLCDDVEGKDGCSVANGEKIKDVTMEEQDQGEDRTEIHHPTLDESTSGEQVKDLRDDEVLFADERLLVNSSDDVQRKDGCSVANGEQIKEVTTKEQDQGGHTEILYPTLDESTAGKGRGKQRTPNRACLFPFKRLLNPIPFKKKARKFKNKIKLV